MFECTLIWSSFVDTLRVLSTHMIFWCLFQIREGGEEDAREGGKEEGKDAVRDNQEDFDTNIIVILEGWFPF